MAQAKIIMVDSIKMGDFYFTKDAVALAQKYLNEGYYSTVGTVEVFDMWGEDVAEYVFDLTNNPYRQAERERLYGRGRSVSVGDIVEFEGIKYLCRPTGWVVVDMALA